ncbi:M48 family metalloprotease [Halorubrum halodurans]|jgi:Zn-dependent protease with chaperone function|uniref:Peptidase n=1 Tax=Halorubrum halodurans TaxID=1383851 RepID=A0A256IJ65_9EURY|nr:M48 family metalloprotease [Halorubrum halodurans]OYR56503.1 peptidase [Halorubrum halodurans]
MLTAAFLVGVVVLAFLAVAVGPLYAADRFRDLREPTGPERAALDELRREAGLSVDRVAVVEGADPDAIEVSVEGPPRRRVLLLTEAVLGELNEEVALGLLAAEAGRVRTYYAEFRAVAIAVVVGLLTAIVTTAVAFDAGFSALVAIGLASFWVGRRVQYAADDRAADAVGAARVADAFETVAERRGVEPETGDWSTWFEVQPPLGDRIAALRERAADDA